MKTIVCLGDSITCNWNEKSYTDYWQALINQTKLPYKIINAGINGETAQDGYYRLHSDVLAHDPFLITIMFGHNDADPVRNISPELYANYLRKIINLTKHQSSATIWLLTPQQIGSKQFENRYIPFLDLLKTTSKDKNVKLVNLWNVYKDLDLDTIYTYQIISTYMHAAGKDWVHPNAKGQKIIAKALMDQLKKANL